MTLMTVRRQRNTGGIWRTTNESKANRDLATMANKTENKKRNECSK